MKKGYIYVVQDNYNRVKIGKTRFPEKRFSDIQAAAGLDIVNSWVSPITFHYGEIEQSALRHFRNVNIKSEWFKCAFDSAVNQVETLLHFYNQLYTEHSVPLKKDWL